MNKILNGELNIINISICDVYELHILTEMKIRNCQFTALDVLRSQIYGFKNLQNLS